VLTANHVGERAIEFGGIAYQPVVGSKIRLLTDDTTTADLILYRIIGQPAVPAVTLAESPPVAGSEEVTMIGQGWNREAALTEWTSSWTEAPPGKVVYRGLGTVQLVAPQLAQWNFPDRDAPWDPHTGAIGILKLQFVPEPRGWLLMVAGLGFLMVLHRVSRRG
jgi:hypothetical protein